MKYMKLFLITIAGLLIVACGNESDLVNNHSQERVEIKLGSSLNVATRAAFTATQGEEIASGEIIYAWIDDVGDPSATPTPIAASEYVTGWTLSAAAPVNTGDPQVLNSVGPNKYYFPTTGRNINIYALHGNFGTAVTEGTTTWATFETSLTHSVEKNQNSDGNYEKSDLFCAHLLNKGKTDGTLNLPFNHVLSKVEVYLFRGTGVSAADLSNISSITLKSPELTGDVTLTKPSDATTQVASVAVPETSNKDDITMRLQKDASGVDKSSEAPEGFSPDDDDMNAYAFGEAVIIPQTIGTPGETPVTADFISVNFSEGGSLVAKVAQTFDAGTRYRFFIIVNRTGLQLTAKLSDWTSGGTIPGVAD